MNKVNKKFKIINISIMFITISLYLFLALTIEKLYNENKVLKNKYFKNSVKEIIKNGEQKASSTSIREIPYIQFNNYKNLDRILPRKKTKEEIIKTANKKEIYLEMEFYDKFPNYSGYYLPIYIIGDIEKIDINNDNIQETIIYYSCYGDNALPRNLDIIKDNKIIFSAEGGNLSLEPINNDSGFYIKNSGLTMPRYNGYTKTKFILNDSSNFYAISETDIKY